MKKFKHAKRFLSIFATAALTLSWTPAALAADIPSAHQGQLKASAVYDLEQAPNLGTLEVTGLSSVGLTGKANFKFKLVSPRSDAYVSSWEVVDANKNTFTQHPKETLGANLGQANKTLEGSFEVNSSVFVYGAGTYYLKFDLHAPYTGDNDMEDATVYVPFKVTYGKINSKNVTIRAYDTKVVFPYTFGYASQRGEKTAVQFKEDGKWVTKKVMKTEGENQTLSGLKANTTYQMRLIGYDSKASEGAPSGTITFTTGHSEKPVISSVKVSNIKQTYHKKRYIAGHWEGTVWRKGYYTSAYWTTSYKLKVTLKKKVADTQGVQISVYGSNYDVNGTGKTFTTTVSDTGKNKGKTRSVTVRAYRNAKYKGYTPQSAGKKFTIK